MTKSHTRDQLDCEQGPKVVHQRTGMDGDQFYKVSHEQSSYLIPDHLPTIPQLFHSRKLQSWCLLRWAPPYLGEDDAHTLVQTAPLWITPHFLWRSEVDCG